MDLTAVFDFTIPSLHPLAIHLPLVAVPVAAVAAVGYAAVGGARWRYSALGSAAVAAAGALFANRTGEGLEEQMVGDPMVELLVEAHEWAAEWSLYTSAAALVVLLGLTWHARRRPTPELQDSRAGRVVAALLLVAAAGFVLYAGHVGATMVWGVPVD